MIGYAEYGVPWWSGPCCTVSGLQDIAAYRELAGDGNCTAWMDNTTLVTATTLLSDMGSKFLTPLTLWDLVTFVRAVVCYERICHHKHDAVADEEINPRLGNDVLVAIPLPYCTPKENSPLAGVEHGAFQWMCDIWDNGFAWMKSLSAAVGQPTLDGEQIAAVTKAWPISNRRHWSTFGS